jgi:hypothetical protein
MEKEGLKVSMPATVAVQVIDGTSLIYGGGGDLLNCLQIFQATHHFSHSASTIQHHMDCIKWTT